MNSNLLTSFRIFIWVSILACCPTVLFTDQACAAPISITRGPYIQKTSPASTVIRWRTDQDSDSRVVFGTTLQNLNLSSSDLDSGSKHRVEINNLLPNTKYYYAIGSSKQILTSADVETFFVTHPAPGTEKDLKIWVVGDSGKGNAGQLSVRNGFIAYQNKTNSRWPDFWIMLGDNAYSSGLDSEYQSGLFEPYSYILRKLTLWPTIGNHDGASANSRTQTGPYYDNFSLPKNAEAGGIASGTEAYYSFNYGKVHFIVLDSYDLSRAADGAMANWLRQDLSADNSDWTIAYWHHPPYSKGSHNSDNPTGADIELEEMRKNILPILEQAGVDLVYSGHSHAYERSYLLDGHYGTSDTLTAANKLDSSAGYPNPYIKPKARTAHSGTVYVVAGSSSQANGGALNHPAMYRSLNQLGSVVLDINGDRLSSKFITDLGEIADRFEISKAPLATPTPIPTPSPAPTETLTTSSPTPTPLPELLAVTAVSEINNLGKVSGRAALLSFLDRKSQRLLPGTKRTKTGLQKGLSHTWRFAWPKEVSKARIFLSARLLQKPKNFSTKNVASFEYSTDGKKYRRFYTLKSSGFPTSPVKIPISIGNAETLTIRLVMPWNNNGVLIDALWLELS